MRNGTIDRDYLCKSECVVTSRCYDRDALRNRFRHSSWLFIGRLVKLFGEMKVDCVYTLGGGRGGYIISERSMSSTVCVA